MVPQHKLPGWATQSLFFSVNMQEKCSFSSIHSSPIENTPPSPYHRSQLPSSPPRLNKHLLDNPFSSDITNKHHHSLLPPTLTMSTPIRLITFNIRGT